MLGRHGRKIKGVSFEDMLGDGGGIRNALFRTIAAGLPSLTSMVVSANFVTFNPLRPSSGDTTLADILTTSSSRLSLTSLSLQGPDDSPLDPATVGSFFSHFPNLLSLTLSHIGRAENDTLLRAVQALRNLNDLSLYHVEAFDHSFATSTGWTPGLRCLEIEGPMVQELAATALGTFVGGFASTLEELRLSLHDRADIPYDIHSFIFPSPPLTRTRLPRLTCYKGWVTSLPLIQHYIQLDASPLRSLGIAELGTGDQWLPLLELVERRKETLRELTLNIVKEDWRGPGFFGSDMYGELLELCEAQGVKVVLEQEEEDREDDSDARSVE